jgi:hypothetical protein
MASSPTLSSTGLTPRFRTSMSTCETNLAVRRLLILVSILMSLTALTAAASTSRLMLHLGDRLTFTGETGSYSRSSGRATGRVFVTATWNRHPRYVVAAPRTDAAGRFHFVFAPTRHGTYGLRILTPDTRIRVYTVQVS